MAAKPLSTESIALTEKKMDMSLDDIIKMSKKNTYNAKKPPRTSNKGRGFAKSVAPPKNTKAQRFLNSRASVRQGALARKRTNYRSDQFLLTNVVARNAQVTPIVNRGINWRNNNQRPAAAKSFQPQIAETTSTEGGSMKPRVQTLDALFASMKQQRMKAVSQQVQRGGSNSVQWRHQNPRGRMPGPVRRPAVGTDR
ncbi:uncharacterized protein LOC144701258 [Wolffia australiana]